MGLHNIKERAEAHNGNVVINSSSNMGTEIIVEVPFKIRNQRNKDKETRARKTIVNS